MSITFRRLLAIITILIFTFTLIPYGSVKAADYATIAQDDTEEPCSSAQVILIIDQSNSMRDRNDKALGLRNFLPMHVADILARNYINARLTASRLESPLKVQLAVVQFATGAMEGLEWTTIAPTSDEAWAEQRRAIDEAGLLSEEEFGKGMFPVIGNGTNFAAAFNKVVELTQKADPQVTGCPKRTYVLLTDGRPDFQGDPIEEPALKDYMDNLKKQVDAKLLGPGNALYVIAINDSTDNYWLPTEKYWQNITQENNKVEGEPTRALKVSSQAEIGYQVDDIINYRLNQGRVMAQVGPNVVPPYVERVIFTFYKPDKANTIEISDPKGNILTAGDNVTISGSKEAIQTIELKRPDPGVYTLTTNARKGDYFITQDMLFIKTNLSSEVNTFYQFGDFPVRISLVDSNNQPIPKYKDEKYRLNIDANLISSDTKRVIPVSLSHDMESGQITGTFTPLYTGENILSISAYAFDDEGKKWTILESPFADFDLEVDKLNLEIGDPENLQSECQVTQYSSFTIPLSFSMASTGEKKQLLVKPEWKVEADGISKIMITGPDTQDSYQLTGTPEKSGNLELAITANGINPVNGESIPVSNSKTTISVAPGHRYQFSIDDIRIKPSRFLVMLKEILNKAKGNSNPDAWVIGRNFFFSRPNLTIITSIIENSTPLTDAQLLPAMRLTSLKGEMIKNEGWKDEKNKWSMTFVKPPLGCYTLDIRPACTTELVSQRNIKSMCVIPGLSEWIIWLVLGLILLAGLFFLARWLLCKFWNPLNGFVAIIDQDGHRVWYTPIGGNSCWTFELDELHTCMLTRIKICGVFHARNRATVKLYQRNQNTMKEECIRKVEVDFSRSWRPILFGVGSRVHWSELEQTLPR